KRWEVNNVGAPDMLLRNDGGVFRDVSREVGIIEDKWQGNGAMWCDFNNDGWQDLYVGNDFEDPDLLYRNNGNGTFSEVAKEVFAHVTWFSMGSDTADVNNDGLADLLSLDMAATTHYKSKTTMGAMGTSTFFMETAEPLQYMHNCLQLGTGAGRFLEVARQAGVANSDWSWAAKFGDMDNDGWVDLFVSNGMTRNFNDSDHPLDMEKLVGAAEWDQYEGQPARPETNQAYRNLGSGVAGFEDVAEAWGLAHHGMSYGAAWCDLEGDGDLDLVVSNLEEPPGVFMNRGQVGNWLGVRLEGKGVNRAGLGARVEIETASGKQMRDFNPMRGFSSTDQPLVHFGLGEAMAVEKMTVWWPDGEVQELLGVKGNRVVEIEQDSSRLVPGEERGERLFVRGDGVLRGVWHWEEPFPDFKHQPLLPNSLSRSGPGMACGDVDGDGVDEIFVGAGAGQVGWLVKRNGAGRWVGESFAAGEAERGSEDMGAVFFDADGDGDKDLYVVSGSVEAPPGHAVFQDRMYVNDGEGRFVRNAGAVPEEGDSGSVVAAADYDRDGDVDLFVGGRSVPGAYPVTPVSHLWRNSGKGIFEEAAGDGLAKVGLVTSALWSDVDGDGWVDLLVACEWGAVRLLRNVEGTLEDATESAGLAGLTGWWNGICGADFDGDGDVDYVVTSFGRNTKYHASAGSPAVIYYGDFDGTGKRHLVEVENEAGRLLPMRGFSCSSGAMPGLRKKLKSYHEFASAALEEVYEPKRLASALRLEATVLESGVLWNDGKGRFEFGVLPELAQVSPSFGCVAGDFDADGKADVMLVQNFYEPQVETRPMNSGVGVFLRGNGKGGFAALWPGESGVVLPGNGRSLVVADFDGNGRADFLAGQSDDEPEVLLGLGEAGLSVRLGGEAAGARVEFNGRVAEVYAGGGFLSQSGPVVWLGGHERGRLSVRWGDGELSEVQVKVGGGQITVER
ncbi:MAG: VCBS repeat-containing protein, partial [Verrucomicrobiales bacterium]|nr:VCBS repeat-containing protein [Verrucomicrobiales bacterium]